MISDRKLLQMVKEKMIWIPCSIVRGMVWKLVEKTWMFLDTAVGVGKNSHNGECRADGNKFCVRSCDLLCEHRWDRLLPHLPWWPPLGVTEYAALQ